MVNVVTAPLLALYARSNGIINIFKISKRNLPPVANHVGLPFANALVKANADATTCVMRRYSPVLGVSAIADFTKIANAIVLSVPINVVNLINGPCAIVNRPGDTMGRRIIFKHLAYPVSLCIGLFQSFFARVSAVPAISPPFEGPIPAFEDAFKMMRRTLPPEKLPAGIFISQQLAQEVG